jgi:hypothetical protein
MLCSHVFLDSCGKLEGESHVAATVNATAKIWYRREQSLPRLMASVVNHPAARNIPLWKLAIHRTMEFQSIDLLISTRSQPPEGGWVRPDMLVIFLTLILAQTLYTPHSSSPSSSRSRFPRQPSMGPQRSQIAQPPHGPEQWNVSRSSHAIRSSPQMGMTSRQTPDANTSRRQLFGRGMHRT